MLNNESAAGLTTLSNNVFDQLIQYPNAMVLPANQHKAVTARYTPKDPRYLAYSPPLWDKQDEVLGAIPYITTTSVAAGPADDACPQTVLYGMRGIMTFAATGLTPGATIYCVLRINWEGTPLTGSYLAGDAVVSVSDSLLLDHGMSTSAGAPMVGSSAFELPPAVSRMDATSGSLYKDPSQLIAHVAAGNTASAPAAAAIGLPTVAQEVSKDKKSDSGGVGDFFGDAFGFIKDKVIPTALEYGPEIMSGIETVLALL